MDLYSIIATCSIILLIILAIHLWLRKQYTYWKKQNIEYIEPKAFFGNLKDLILLRTSFGELFRSFYNYSKNNSTTAPIIGIYILHKPALLIRDPRIIKLILIKNFHMFSNRFEAADPIHDHYGALTLPLAKYPIWRESRKKMSELFTSGKLKNRIYPLMLAIAQDLEEHVERRFSIEIKKQNKTNADGGTIIEVKELCALFTTDLTAALFYSMRVDGLKNGTSSMHQAALELLHPSLKKAFNFFITFFLPQLTTLLRVKVFPSQYTNFMQNMIQSNLSKRYSDNAATTYKDDLIDILLQLQNELNKQNKNNFTLNNEFMASQAAIFLLAGFETSSSTIAFILYELAKQSALQKRLRLEIQHYFDMNRTVCESQSSHTNDNIMNAITYEQINTMPYLHMVVSEGLRMYPAAAFINRECTPASNIPGFPLQPYCNFLIPASMPAYISILGLHRDAKHWPNPDHFDPERFTSAKINTIDPMVYIPFGAGPHGCIGSRLGLLQVKLGLVHILRKYSVAICDTSPTKIEFDPTSFMLQNKGGINLRFLQD